MFRNKLIAVYVLLVGVPLLALVLVLKACAGLIAPAAVFTRAAGASTQPAPMNLFLLVLQVAVILLTRMGTLAISCAAVDDITGWCILAYIVVLVRSEGSSKPLWVTIAGAVGFVLLTLMVVRRILPRFETSFRRHGRLTDNAVSLMLVLALISAFTTEWLGIHSLFGAFFMGAVMPKSQDFVKGALDKLESLTVVALLPLFFAFSGLRTSVNMVRGQLWLYTPLVIAVAIAGKFGGSMMAARMAGEPWRDATALGILMNTRGLMELIALNIGLDIGVISPTVFTIMALMALVTTFMTSPLLEWVYPAKLMLVEEEVLASDHVA